MPYFATSLSSLARAAMLAYDNSSIYKFNNFPTPQYSEASALANLMGSSAALPGTVARKMLAGFEFIDERYVPDSNYYGIAMRNRATGEIVIAHRGTETSSLTDVAMDKVIANGDVPTSAHDAAAFSQKIASNNPGATIINVGDSKGAYEANYANAKQVDQALAYGQDTSRFAFLGLDTPGMNPDRQVIGLSRALPEYSNGINIVISTDPVNQLTRSYGLQLPGQTVYLQVPGTGAVDNPASLGPTCRATAAAIAPNFDGVLTAAGGGVAAGVNAWFGGDSSNTSIGRLFAACNLDLRGHNGAALADALDSKVPGMNLNGALNDPSLRGNATNTAIGAVGWGAPEFQSLAKNMINVYIGKGYGFGAGDGQVDEGAITATVASAFAGRDLTGAAAFDLNGTVYVKLASGEVLWVTPNGKLGSEKVTTFDDGSAIIETHNTNGTSRVASIDTNGLLGSTVRDPSGQVLGRLQVAANGASTIELIDTVSGEHYTQQSSPPGPDQTASLTGVDAQGHAVAAHSAATVDTSTGLTLTTTENTDGSTTTVVTNAGGAVLVTSTQTVYDDGSLIRTNVRADGTTEVLTFDSDQHLVSTQTPNGVASSGDVSVNQTTTQTLTSDVDNSTITIATTRTAAGDVLGSATVAHSSEDDGSGQTVGLKEVVSTYGAAGGSSNAQTVTHLNLDASPAQRVVTHDDGSVVLRQNGVTVTTDAAGNRSAVIDGSSSPATVNPDGSITAQTASGNPISAQLQQRFEALRLALAAYGAEQVKGLLAINPSVHVLAASRRCQRTTVVEGDMKDLRVSTQLRSDNVLIGRCI